MARASCVVCGRPAVHRHHIISRQAIKRATSDPAERRRLLADERNLLWLDVTCHFRHESAFKRLPFSVLSQEALDFAEELGLSQLLDRYYAKEEYPHGRVA